MNVAPIEGSYQSGISVDIACQCVECFYGNIGQFEHIHAIDHFSRLVKVVMYQSAEKVTSPAKEQFMAAKI